jgi:hypothetical protein
MLPPRGHSPEERNKGMEIIDTLCWRMSTTLGLDIPQHLPPSNMEAGATIMVGQITHQAVNAR